MKKQGLFFFTALIAVFIVGSSCDQIMFDCEKGETQECFCPDGTTGTQTCRTSGWGWEACNCTYYATWYDRETDLSWQDPQKDAYNYQDEGLTQPDAKLYCDELVLAGQ